MKIAIVGAGIAGLGAAWSLSHRHAVTVYEAAPTLGGHANTTEVQDRGRLVPVDTGFIVYNEANYPNLTRLFASLDVPTEPSDMSFAVSLGDGAFEYQARALGLAAQPRNLLRPSYARMIADVLRFCREAPALVGSGSTESTGAYLDRMGYSRAFVEDFLLPEVGCIWSSRLEEMRSYPAETMVRFLGNHGLLQVTDRPRWRTVSGGSREYVGRVAAAFRDGIRTSTPVAAVRRGAEEVVVLDANGGIDRFDQVVFATHADVTLSILGSEATDHERRVLGAFGFEENRAVLHRDPALMPRRRRAWSSWNYLADGRSADDRSRSVSLTYWMNRLQNLDTERPVLVTLNPLREPRDIEAEYTYHHPRFDRAAVEAQAEIPRMNGSNRTWFAGAWSGYGFHEDGLRSGLAVAGALGSPAPWHAAPIETTPAEPVAVPA
jgi:uncharacterized protein